jgi:hypothetical protein
MALSRGRLTTALHPGFPGEPESEHRVHVVQLRVDVKAHEVPD